MVFITEWLGWKRPTRSSSPPHALTSTMYLPDLFAFVSSKFLFLACEYFCLEVDIFYWIKRYQHKLAFCEGYNYRRPCAGCLWLFYWWVMQSVPQPVEESYLVLWSDTLQFCSHLFKVKTFPNFRCLAHLVDGFLLFLRY